MAGLEASKERILSEVRSLRDDYSSRLKTVEAEIVKARGMMKESRLRAKAGAWRTIVSELNRILKD